METLSGKVALVTGASSGFGKAISARFVQQNMKVVGCARNFEKLKQMADELNKTGPGEILIIRCDVSMETDVKNMFKTIEEKWGMLHICVNNAGVAHSSPLLSGNMEDWKSMLGVNVMGLCLCTKEAVALMGKSGIDNGHIILINSSFGLKVDPNPMTHFYSATKHAVVALAHGLRNELKAQNSHIRVSSIFPGLAQTEMIEKLLGGDSVKAGELFASNASIKADDITDAILYALSAPKRVDVTEVVVQPAYQR